MRKSIVALAATAALGLGSLFGGFPTQTEASKLSDLNSQKAKVQQDRSEVNKNINKSDQKIQELQAAQDKVHAEIKRLDFAISDTSEKINKKTQDIQDTKLEIQKLKEEIKILQERMAKREELLKDRARNFQESGGLVSYLDVLMGSTNFSDFIDRANAVATLMDADQDILKQQQLDKEELEKKQEKVQKDLASLQSMLMDLQSMKQQLASQRGEKDALMKKLVKKEEEERDHQMDLSEEADLLSAQEAALAKAVELEKAHIAEEAERARKEAEARAAAEAAAAAAARAQHSNNNNSNNSVSSSAPAPAPSEPVTPPVSGGTWMKPTTGINTSGFGARWGTTHFGVDWANRAPNVSVVAAASGVVIRSYYSSSYGNVVFIAHSINGQTWTTVYAHMERRGVSQGQVVSKGQFLGIMGNTGDSTGKHLHFELHKGQWTANKANAVDPFAYGVPR